MAGRRSEGVARKQFRREAETEEKERLTHSLVWPGRKSGFLVRVLSEGFGVVSRKTGHSYLVPPVVRIQNIIVSCKTDRNASRNFAPSLIFDFSF